jgi:nucleoid DNA-binding protein
VLADVLAAEGRIELRNFGIFEVRERKAWKARNPQTGTELMAPSRKTVKFHAGKVMKARVAGAGDDQAIFSGF